MGTTNFNIMDVDALITDSLTIGSTAITATGAEINTLHSSAVTNADLVKLHAVTASAVELNKLASSGAKVPSGTQVVNTAATKTNYTTGDLDVEAEIIAAINATNVSVNAILTALVAFGIMAAPE